MFTFIFSIKTSTLFNYTLSTLFFYVISILFAFLFNFDSITSIFVNELIIDLTTQKIRLSNATSANVEIELKRAFNYYAKLCSTKNFSMNLLIGLTVLFNCNSIVIKTTLTLFVKKFFLRIFTNRNYIRK